METPWTFSQIEAASTLDRYLFVQNEDLDRVSQDAVKVHRLSRRRRVENVHGRRKIVGLKADGDLTPIRYSVADRLANSLTPKEVSMGSETLLPLYRVFNVRDDDNFGHLVPLLFDRDGLSKIARLIHIFAFDVCDVVGEQLERNDVDDR